MLGEEAATPLLELAWLQSREKNVGTGLLVPVILPLLWSFLVDQTSVPRRRRARESARVPGAR